MSPGFLLPFSALCLLCTASLQAVTTTINIGTVTYIRSDNTGNNYGADGTLIIGKTAGTPGATLRGLLAASLSSIPAGSTINSITLNLNVANTGSVSNTAGAVSLELYQLTGTFTEGTGSASGAAGTASWNQRATGTAWTTPGGDFSTLLSSASDDPTNVTGSGTSGSAMTFDSTSAFVSAAQLALNNGTDLAVLLKLNSASETDALRRAFFYYSDDATNAALRPTFTIDYTIPEPTTPLLAAAGALAFLSRRRRA